MIVDKTPIKMASNAEFRCDICNITVNSGKMKLSAEYRVWDEIFKISIHAFTDTTVVLVVEGGITRFRRTFVVLFDHLSLNRVRNYSR